MKTVLLILMLGLCGFAGFAAYVRLAPVDPMRWRVDPMEMVKARRTNNFIVRPGDGDAVAPIFREEPDKLAARIDAVMLSMPRTVRIMGAPALMEMTYMTRSAGMGFPDFTSVRVIWGADGSSFAAYARSRFGGNDYGVNKARMMELIATLSAPS